MGKKKLHLTDEERIVWRQAKGLPHTAMLAMFGSCMAITVLGLFLLTGQHMDTPYFWTMVQGGLFIFSLGVFAVGLIIWYTSK